MEFVLSFFLIFLRCIGMLAVFRLLNGYLRLGGVFLLALVIAVSFWRILPVASVKTVLPLGILQTALVFSRELILGAILALPWVITLECWLMSARMVDVSRGAQFSEQVLGGDSNPSSLLESLCKLGSLALVFSTGAYRIPLLVLERSFDNAILSDLGESRFLLFRELAFLFGYSLSAALLLAAPCLIVLWLIEVVAALGSKMLTRVNLSFELMPLRMLLGALIFGILLTYNAKIPDSLLEQVLYLEKRLFLGGL